MKKDNKWRGRERYQVGLRKKNKKIVKIDYLLTQKTNLTRIENVLLNKRMNMTS